MFQMKVFASLWETVQDFSKKNAAAASAGRVAAQSKMILVGPKAFVKDI